MNLPLRRRTARVYAVLVVVPVLAFLAGCSAGSAGAPSATESAAPYAVVSAPTLAPGDAIPSPTGPVILTVTGTVSDATQVIPFDLAALESLGLVEYSVNDDVAEGRTAMFRGVLLDRLLAVVGMGDGTTLHMVALNDYAVDIPASDAGAFPVLLATSVDGARMPIDKYGPIRVIYPTDNDALDPTVYDPRRIWQLKSIEVQ